MLYENIKKLVEYGIQTGLTPECERIYTTNLLLELFQEDSYEDVEIEAPDDCIGSVIESLGLRRGIMENMDSMDGMTKVHYIVPSRGLIGFMTNFLTMTKGYGIINHSFLEYRPLEGEAVGERQLGVLISIETGQTTAYALGGVESNVCWSWCRSIRRYDCWGTCKGQ